MVTVINPLLESNEMDALLEILQYLEEERKDYAALSPTERSTHIYRAVLTLHSCGLIPRPREIEYGRVVETPGALRALANANQEPWQFLARHSAGDWGDVSPEDWLENDYSLTNHCRLLSAYRTNAGQIIWVITEADRSATTILLPEEY